MKNERKEVELFDVGIVAYLSLKGHKVLRYNQHTDNIVSFVFEYSSQLEKDINDYENYKGEIIPKAYINLYRRLRNKVMALKKE